MSEIKVKYDDVRNTTTKASSHLASEVNAIEVSHRHVLSDLNNTDGITNANATSSSKKNMGKKVIVNQNLNELLHFKSETATQIQSEEKTIANTFNIPNTPFLR